MTGELAQDKPVDFNPRPPRGERLAEDADRYDMQLFQSTPSARRATQLARVLAKMDRISIHALREESDVYRKDRTRASYISIHALREESDLCHRRMRCRTSPISIHALREESDDDRA